MWEIAIQWCMAFRITPSTFPPARILRLAPSPLLTCPMGTCTVGVGDGVKKTNWLLLLWTYYVHNWLLLLWTYCFTILYSSILQHKANQSIILQKREPIANRDTIKLYAVRKTVRWRDWVSEWRSTSFCLSKIHSKRKECRRETI